MEITNRHKGLRRGDVIGWTDSTVPDELQSAARSFSLRGYTKYPYTTTEVVSVTDERGVTGRMVDCKKYKIVGISCNVPDARMYTQQHIPAGHTNVFLEIRPVSGLGGAIEVDGHTVSFGQKMYWCVNLTQFTVVRYQDGAPIALIEHLFYFGNISDPETLTKKSGDSYCKCDMCFTKLQYQESLNLGASIRRLNWTESVRREPTLDDEPEVAPYRTTDEDLGPPPPTIGYDYDIYQSDGSDHIVDIA